MSVHLRLLADGRSKLCLIPALICEWNLMLRALLSAHAASNWVVSWSTRCVYLVRPDRPKFFTCSTRHTSNTAPFRVGHARNFRPKTTSPPLLKQETVSGSGISWAVCKSAPRRQITTPAPHHSVFYKPDALPAAQPTASKH